MYVSSSCNNRFVVLKVGKTLKKNIRYISAIGCLKAFSNLKHVFLPPHSELPPVAGVSSLRK